MGRDGGPVVAQQQIQGKTGTVDANGALVAYPVPGSVVATPFSVSASVDGSGASGAFLPCLSFYTIAGKLIARSPAPEVAAGSSAEISWFPHVGGSVSASAVKFVGARIQSNAQQAVSSDTLTDFQYQVVAFDTGGMANLGADNRKLTFPYSGLWLVICESYWTWSTGAPGLRYNSATLNSYVTGTPNIIADDQRMAVWAPLSGNLPGEPHSTNTAVGLIQASAGDFIASGGQQKSGATQQVNGSSGGFLAAILLGGN